MLKLTSFIFRWLVSSCDSGQTNLLENKEEFFKNVPLLSNTAPQSIKSNHVPIYQHVKSGCKIQRDWLVDNLDETIKGSHSLGHSTVLWPNTLY